MADACQSASTCLLCSIPLTPTVQCCERPRPSGCLPRLGRNGEKVEKVGARDQDARQDGVRRQGTSDIPSLHIILTTFGLSFASHDDMQGIPLRVNIKIHQLALAYLNRLICK